MRSKLRNMSRRVLPQSVRRHLLHLTRWPPVGRVSFENLRRLEPISRSWGGDRGQPIDRYYIERFLREFQADIHGHVMEVGGNQYTIRFGGDAVTISDVLHVEEGQPGVTIVADLARANHLEKEQFDCIICTQTLHLIPDATAAVKTLYRLLKPGGVLLITGPAISPLAMEEARKWGDYWRFTTYGLRWLLLQAFAPEAVTVTAYGNVLSAVAFLHGLAAGELQSHELDQADRQYELLVAGRAVR